MECNNRVVARKCIDTVNALQKTPKNSKDGMLSNEETPLTLSVGSVWTICAILPYGSVSGLSIFAKIFLDKSWRRFYV